MSKTLLNKEQRQFWNKNGFILLKNVLSGERISILKNAFDSLFQSQRNGVDRNLFALFAVDKGKEFLDLIDAPETFDCILSIMGPCIQLSSSHVLARPVKNGFEGPIHSDGGPGMQSVVTGRESLPIQIKIQYFLTDLERENSGNFIMIPGTHHSVFPSYLQNLQEHTEVTQLKASAGDAVIFSSSLWHGAAQNQVGIERQSIIYGYSQLFVRPFDYRIVPKELLDKSTPRQRRLLGDLGSERPNIFFYPPLDQVTIMEGVRDGNLSKQSLLNSSWSLIADKIEDYIPIEKLEIANFIGEFEDYAPWGALIERAKQKKADYTQAQAEFMIKQQGSIPEAWRSYNLIFPGTILKSSTGHLHCPFLKWTGSEWCLQMYWFLYDFYKEDRLLILKR